MKLLKLRKVKISKIGNLHTIYGGATNSCQGASTLPPPRITMDDECLRSIINPDDCATVTNTTGSRRTDPNQDTTSDGLGG